MSVATTQDRPIVIVRTATDLAALRSGRLRPRHRGLRLELPGIGDEDARRSADRIAALRNDCGCSVGTWFLLPATCAVGAWLWMGGPGGPDHLVPRMGVSLAVVVAAAGLGKAAGVLRSRREMRREIDRVARRMGAEPGIPRGSRALGR